MFIDFQNTRKNKDLEVCFDEKSVVFMQFGCMLPIDTIANRKKFGLLLGCVGTFIALFAVNYIDAMKKVT